MLGLILLYFAGRAFYNLAEQHGKNKWLFAILGVVSYYGGLFLGGIVIALVYEIGLSRSIDEANDLFLGILAIPIGVLVCWGFYKVLESSWKKDTRRVGDAGILDADLPNEGNSANV